MALRQFLLPDAGEGLTEAEILTWHVAPGDTVTVNQIIVEIETAKAAVELPCPFAGVVAELLVPPGVIVDVGVPIISIPLRLAVRIANIAGGVVVGKIGTSVARADDLLAAISPQGGTLRKVVGRDVAAEQVERWRRRGWRTGFTNGCFDLLHPGHVHLLEQARSQCDRLVVGLNSDASVRRLKGASRPVQPEAARAAVLASLSAVDLVVIYDEDTPEETLRELRPELLVKGADYTLDKVVGAELVRGWGGTVWLAELLPGHSTTATVMRIAKG